MIQRNLAEEAVQWIRRHRYEREEINSETARAAGKPMRKALQYQTSLVCQNDGTARKRGNFQTAEFGVRRMNGGKGVIENEPGQYCSSEYRIATNVRVIVGGASGAWRGYAR